MTRNASRPPKPCLDLHQVRPEVAPAAPAPVAVKKGGKPPAGTKYTFFVGPGNNSELVRQTLERRPWWTLGKEDDPELNLKWLQVPHPCAVRGALCDLPVCDAAVQGRRRRRVTQDTAGPLPRLASVVAVESDRV